MLEVEDQGKGMPDEIRSGFLPEKAPEWASAGCANESGNSADAWRLIRMKRDRILRCCHFQRN